MRYMEHVSLMIRAYEAWHCASVAFDTATRARTEEEMTGAERSFWSKGAAKKYFFDI